MKKLILPLVGLALASAISLSMKALAAESDPFLTNKSIETFDIDMGGLTLSLPIELKERAVPKKINEDRTDLSIGNIDIAYELSDSVTGSSKTIKGWVEFEGGSAHCDVDKNVEAIHKNSLTKDIYSRIKQVANANFNGYIVTTEMATKGKFNGLYLEVYNRKISECYTISLAIQDFDSFTRSEIRKALSPLSDSIKKSIVDYSLKGAAQ